MHPPRWGLRPLVEWLSLPAGVSLGVVAGIAVAQSAFAAAGLAAAAALAVAMLARARGVRNAAVAAVACLVSPMALEGALRLTRAPPVAYAITHFEPVGLFVPDGDLGWRLNGPAIIRAVRPSGRRMIYEASYSLGADGVRVTPSSRSDGDTVLFLGDSFTFGEGIGDADTLPERYAIETGRRFRIVNLGVPAYGPNQVLAQLEAGVIDRHVRGRVRQVFLWFNDDHLARASGDKEKEWWWGRAPRYRLTDGGVRRVGTIADAAADRGATERAIAESLKGVELAGMLRPIVRSFPQIDLVEALLGRIAAIVRERHGVELVVLYWTEDHPMGLYRPRVAKAIERAGARLVLVPDLLAAAGLKPDEAMIPDDGHPTPRLNAVLAAALAAQYAPEARPAPTLGADRSVVKE